MFSSEQYRAKAAEFKALLTNTSRSPNETSELRKLEQSYTTLAENEEWMAINIDKTIRRRRIRDTGIDLDEDEQILRCGETAANPAAAYCPHAVPTEIFIRQQRKSLALAPERVVLPPPQGERDMQQLNLSQTTA